MSTVSSKGRDTENRVIAFLRSYGLKVERRRLAGVHDRGDVAGWETDKGSVCVEIKTASGGWRPPEWARELDDEANNAGAETGFIVARPKGKPDPEDYLVVIRLPWFMELMREAGYLPPEKTSAVLDKALTAMRTQALVNRAEAKLATSFRGAPSDGRVTGWTTP